MSTSSARLLPVAVPGQRGAFSQQAARRFFGRNVPALSCKSSAEAVRALTEGRASYAVLAVENSITGAFDGVTDAFFESDVTVVGEVKLEIRYALLAQDGVRLEELSAVLSHPTALEQCRARLDDWGLETRKVEDCAEAAEALAASDDRTLAVLGSCELGATYGLATIAEGLADEPDNCTRFLVLAQGSSKRSEGWRNAVQVGPVSTPRLLKTLRIQLESLGASRVRVPFLGSQDGRSFLIEFDHRGGDGWRTAAEACGSIPHRFLGAWVPSARLAI